MTGLGVAKLEPSYPRLQPFGCSAIELIGPVVIWKNTVTVAEIERRLLSGGLLWRADCGIQGFYDWRGELEI
jgi:hypothetical protein